MKATHQALFNNKKVVDMFLVGVGGVGGELIEQIKHQKEYLAKKDIEIRVCALANSTKMLLDENGLNLDNWKADLEMRLSLLILMCCYLSLNYITW